MITHIAAINNCDGFQNAPTKAATPNIPNVTIIALAWNNSPNTVSAIASIVRVTLFFIAQTKKKIRRTIQHFAKDNNPFRYNTFSCTVT